MREVSLGILKADEKSQSKLEESPVTDFKETKEINLESKADSKSSKSYNKPAWALTKEAADDVKSYKEINEEEELIEFAKSLDFDRYIDDIEVQTMVEKLRRRIVELEKEVVLEDQREADAEERANRREMLELMVYSRLRFYYYYYYYCHYYYILLPHYYYYCYYRFYN